MGHPITNELGNLIETGTEFGPSTFQKVFGPGETWPNLVLGPGTGLEMMEVANGVKVTELTPIQSLIGPNMGVCQWAACLTTPGLPANYKFTIFGPVLRE